VAILKADYGLNQRATRKLPNIPDGSCPKGNQLNHPHPVFNVPYFAEDQQFIPYAGFAAFHYH
jgi:hypothetical protein